MTVSYERLPLFPLPLVLFPGARLKLHIFESRYRQLIADCLTGDRRFGLIRLAEGEAELEIPSGTIGCTAEVLSVEPLADGRSNIAVVGRERFELEAFLPASQPYHLTRTRPVNDELQLDADVAAIADRVREIFRRVGQAARALRDEPDPLPELPADAAALSFAIAAVIDIDLDTRQELLSSRSPLDRLRRLDALLTPAVEPLAERAHVHMLAKTNGRGVHARP